MLSRSSEILPLEEAVKPRRDWKAVIVEVLLGLVMVAIGAPGVIWWALTLWSLFQ